MAEITITIAVNSVDADGVMGVPKRDKAIYDVSTTLDAGDDVKFVDASGNNAEINYLNVSTDGTIEYRPIQYSDGGELTIYLIKGGWHKVQGVHKIFASGTDSSLNIRAKVGN